MGAALRQRFPARNSQLPPSIPPALVAILFLLLFLVWTRNAAACIRFRDKPAEASSALSALHVHRQPVPGNSRRYLSTGDRSIRYAGIAANQYRRS